MNTGPIIALLFMFALFVLAMARVGWGYYAVRRDAREEWPLFSLTKAGQAKDMNEARFVDAYVRAHGPRGLLYAAITLLAALLVTPLAVMLLTGFYAAFIAQPDAAKAASSSFSGAVSSQLRLDGPLVYAFFLFFGLIASWGLTAFAIAWRFHRKRPGDLDDELQGLPDSDAPLPPRARPRPKWSPLVRTKDGLKLPQQIRRDALDAAKPDEKESST